MFSSFYTKFWFISLLGLSSCILKVDAVATVSPSKLPPTVIDKLRRVNGPTLKSIFHNSRRIILGYRTESRPYMVYLKLPSSASKFQEYRRWLCGGAIIHEEYILTSAACIEDVKHFYVVSGTYKFSFGSDRHNNPCIQNGAKKAVWKCIPRNYIFDGHENDNIRWMNNDIAVVKLEDELDFTRRVRGCDYAPKPICYNNQSEKMEDPGTPGSIAGWGNLEKYNEWVNARKTDSMFFEQELLEARVTIMPKFMCKRRWGKRYYNIIDNYMVCTFDTSNYISEICMEKYVDCQDVSKDSDEADEAGIALRRMFDWKTMHNQPPRLNISRRQEHLGIKDGGFCENDHGGPLVVGDSAMNMNVVGVISACLVKEKTNMCYGPFLYTSVFKNRILINCAINKDVGHDCSKIFRASVTHDEVEMDWKDHPDGPSKSEIKAMRRKEAEEKLAAIANASAPVNVTKPPVTHNMKVKPDRPLEHDGLIVRSEAADNNETFKEKFQHAQEEVNIKETFKEKLEHAKEAKAIKDANDMKETKILENSTVTQNTTPKTSTVSYNQVLNVENVTIEAKHETVINRTEVSEVKLTFNESQSATNASVSAVNATVI